MSDFTINFFGWCHDGGHDKVWGFVTTSGGTLYNFWGARGKSLTFKRYEGQWGERALLKKAANKTARGRSSGTYREIPVDQIETVAPGFTDELAPQIVNAVLFGKLHGERDG